MTVRRITRIIEITLEMPENCALHDEEVDEMLTMYRRILDLWICDDFTVVMRSYEK